MEGRSLDVSWGVFRGGPGGNQRSPLLEAGDGGSIGALTPRVLHMGHYHYLKGHW